MSIKPGAQKFEILEQIVEDLVTGITLQFEKRDNGEFAIYLYGDFPFGNRTLNFDKDGNPTGGGTHTASCPKPNWIGEVHKSS